MTCTFIGTVFLFRKWSFMYRVLHSRFVFNPARYFLCRIFSAPFPLLLARLMDQYCFARCRLSASATCIAWPVRQPTLHSGTVRLRPVRAVTPCCICSYCISLLQCTHILVFSCLFSRFLNLDYQDVKVRKLLKVIQPKN